MLGLRHRWIKMCYASNTSGHLICSWIQINDYKFKVVLRNVKRSKFNSSIICCVILGPKRKVSGREHAKLLKSHCYSWLNHTDTGQELQLTFTSNPLRDFDGEWSDWLELTGCGEQRSIRNTSELVLQQQTPHQAPLLSDENTNLRLHGHRLTELTYTGQGNTG